MISFHQFVLLAETTEMLLGVSMPWTAVGVEEPLDLLPNQLQPVIAPTISAANTTRTPIVATDFFI